MLSPSGDEASGAFLNWLEQTDNEGKLFLSLVSIHELEKGIALLEHKGANAKAADLKIWLNGLTSSYEDKIFSLDASVAAIAGQLEAKAISAGYNPGMADAIYFMENAKNMKTAYDILANSVMSRVVLGALGLPIEIAIQPIETQARAITTRMNLADLQKADKVNAFAERFLMAEATAAIAAASIPQDPFAMITSLSIQV